MKRLIWGVFFTVGGLLALAPSAVAADPYPGDTAIYGRNIQPNILIIIDTSGSMGNPIVEGGPDKIQIAKDVLTELVANAANVKIGLMRFDTGTHVNEEGKTVKDNEGGEFLSSPVDGLDYVSTVKDMDAAHSSTKTNRAALQSVISSLTAGGYTPLAESLLEAGRYFQGAGSAFSNTIGINSSAVYTSPIDLRCQKNIVILVSDGMSTKDQSAQLTALCSGATTAVAGDCDDDGLDPIAYSSNGSGYLDDVAWYFHNTDLSGDFIGDQTLNIYTIGFGLGGANADAVALLEQTAENGGGTAYLASDYAELSSALQQIVTEVKDVDTSFVAPVVPTSPENRTYSGNRIYLGFFKPVDDNFWLGNLKKFGLGTGLRLVDQDDADALEIDADGDTVFKSTASSYWGTVQDGANVDAGGCGGVLKAWSYVPTEGSAFNTVALGRKIYTYMGTEAALADASNALDIDNSNLWTPTNYLAADDEAHKNQIINYVYGLDAYDNDSAENPHDSVTHEKRAWPLGDMLHSKPEVVSYNTFAYTDETKCAPEMASGSNKTMIYFGGNDGMLHAVRDCDGKELWSFVPPALLPDLKNLGGQVHYPMVDGSVTSYVFDADSDGNIGPEELSDGDSDNGGTDKVILLFGLRRGGNVYYALDVTNPANPLYLWDIDSSEVADIGQTWSQPKLGLVKYKGASSTASVKVVAFVGAGYDNGNEDQRFGNTQLFGENDDGIPANDQGAQTSGGAVSSSSLYNADSSLSRGKGRGVFAFEVATLTGGVPTVATTAHVVWKFIRGESTAPGTTPGFSEARLNYSIPSDIKVLDTDYDGYTDRLYVGDTGGQVWRISGYRDSEDPHHPGVFRPEPTSLIDDWYGQVIFSANPGVASSSYGRKFFNPPSVVFEGDYVGVYMGSGDRAHPLNSAVVDRLYAIYDRGQGTPELIREGSLEDVTGDDLQVTSASHADSCPEGSMAVNCILSRLFDSERYGWFIRLANHDNDPNTDHTAEKALSAPLVFSKVAYFPTYTPTFSTDLCGELELGTARVWAVDYKTGEAVFNFYEGNDGGYEGASNNRAKGDGVVLAAPDRYKNLGQGIPPSPVVVITPGGKAKVMIGVDDVDNSFEDPIVPVYWRPY